MQDVFAGIAAQEDHRMFLVRMSMMEIYNEVLIDLLDPERSNLKILEDANVKGGVVVDNMSEETVDTLAQVRWPCYSIMG